AAGVEVPDAVCTGTSAPGKAGRGAAVEAGARGEAKAAATSASAAPPARAGFTGWTFGVLPELLEIEVGGRDVIGFPALHDDGDSVSIRPFDTPEEAARVHRRGLARLFALALKEQVKAIDRLPGLRELALHFMSFATEAELKAQLEQATLTRCCL